MDRQAGYLLLDGIINSSCHSWHSLTSASPPWDAAYCYRGNCARNPKDLMKLKIHLSSLTWAIYSQPIKWIHFFLKTTEDDVVFKCSDTQIIFMQWRRCFGGEGGTSAPICSYEMVPKLVSTLVRFDVWLCKMRWPSSVSPSKLLWHYRNRNDISFR